MTTDIKSFTDKANPTKAISHAVENQAQANIEKLTRQMERRGVDHDNAAAIAEKIATQAEGPIANDDWMTLDANRFAEDTQKTLDETGLTREIVLTDHNKAEDYVSQVFEKEGIPNGDGGVEKPKNGVASGHYEKRGEGGVGIDLVAAEREEENNTSKIDGCPVLIEVKKYKQTSSAHLENRSVGGEQRQTLEPEVAAWKAQREQRVLAYHRGQEVTVDPESFYQHPFTDYWQQQRKWDEFRIAAQHDGKLPTQESDFTLPVQQMDDLWTRDRWLKLIKTEDGQQRMRDIGVDAKYLDYDRLRSAPDLPEWRDILDRRTTVVVSDRHGSVGKAMFLQAIRDGRSKVVMKIEV
jgi:hypothetical protein